MIRQCHPSDVEAICEVINDAAQAYRGIIPSDRWREPYMSLEELIREIADGIEFWVWEQEGRVIGVMGIQDKGDLVLIRHAYVRSQARQRGVGTALLRHLEGLAAKPILVGTWTDATWAVSFYEKNGYHQVTREESRRLLRKFWKIPERQIETSLVLGKGWE